MSTIVEARGLKMYFPVGRTLGGKPKKAAQGRGRRELFHRRRAKPSASSARAAAARRRSAAASSACMSRRTARFSSTGRISPTSSEKPLTPYRRRMQMIFQDPYASLNPRMTVASHHRRAAPLRRREQGLSDRARARAGRSGRPQAGSSPALSARVFRRPAPARRHRPRARLQPGVHRLRRADLRAGRLHSGAGHQHAGIASGEAGAFVSVRLPRPLHGAPHLPQRGRDVSGLHGRARAGARAVFQHAAPVHAGADERRADSRSGYRRRQPAASTSPATCRPRSIRRAAAASARAARMRPSSARRSARSCARSRRITSSPATAIK